MSKTILKVDNLQKSYDGRQVVKGVSFTVEEGEVFGILGPNGAGKTTTLEMIEAMRPIDAGSAHINGINVAKEPYAIRQIIGVQPQAPALQDKTKLTETLQLFAAAYGARINPMAVLEEVSLADQANIYVENLSGGQKQRLSIAIALVHNPKVLFMDEPTTGLDPQARRHLWELVTQVRAKGVTVILTTHYMEEAEQLCDRVAIMDGGEIKVIDSPKNLVEQLLARGFKKQRHVEQADLEDVFIDITGKGLRD